MPIYEFRCMKCQDIFELLIMNNDEMVEMKCPKCEGDEFEKVMSTASISVGGVAGSGKPGVQKQDRQCQSGSCTTYTIPGPGR